MKLAVEKRQILSLEHVKEQLEAAKHDFFRHHLRHKRMHFVKRLEEVCVACVSRRGVCCGLCSFTRWLERDREVAADNSRGPETNPFDPRP